MQKGPEFLYQPFEKWPIMESVEVKEITEALIQNVQNKWLEKVKENFEYGKSHWSGQNFNIT